MEADRLPKTLRNIYNREQIKEIPQREIKPFLKEKLPGTFIIM